MGFAKMNPQDINNPNLQQPIPPQPVPQQAAQPAPQLVQAQPPQQVYQQPPQVAVDSAPSPQTQSSGLKTGAGVTAIVFGAITCLFGLLSLMGSFIYGLLALGLGVFWIVDGIHVLKAIEPLKANKTLNRIATSAITYAGVIFLFGFFLPIFKLSGAILPIIFAIAISIMSTSYKKKYVATAPSVK